MNKVNVLIISGLFVAPSLQASWQDVLNQASQHLSTPSATSASSLLSNDDIILGLKSALQQGIGFAVDALGSSNGFMNNPKVRIPIPKSIRPVANTLAKLGQQGMVDDFQGTLNRAAEAAVPEGKQILINAVQNMSIEDARRILGGGDTAATDYFKRVSESRLLAKIMPIVQQATDDAGVTASYKKLTQGSGGLGGLGNLGGFSGMLGGAVKAPDLDQYVSEKALDGLFLMIAEQEKAIRENPLERTSDILKKVFR